MGKPRPDDPSERHEYGNPTMTRHQRLVESQIEQAIARGDFDDLPGAGKPLPNLDRRDPDWWVKQWIEREDLHLAPPVPYQLRAEGEQMRETLRGEWREDRVRAIVTDFNKRVLAERLKPEIGKHVYVPTIDVDEAVEQWRADRPAPVARVMDEPARSLCRTRRPWWRRRRSTD